MKFIIQTLSSLSSKRHPTMPKNPLGIYSVGEHNSFLFTFIKHRRQSGNQTITRREHNSQTKAKALPPFLILEGVRVAHALKLPSLFHPLLSPNPQYHPLSMRPQLPIHSRSHKSLQTHSPAQMPLATPAQPRPSTAREYDQQTTARQSSNLPFQLLPCLPQHPTVDSTASMFYSEGNLYSHFLTKKPQDFRKMKIKISSSPCPAFLTQDGKHHISQVEEKNSSSWAGESRQHCPFLIQVLICGCFRTKMAVLSISDRNHTEPQYLTCLLPGFSQQMFTTLGLNNQEEKAIDDAVGKGNYFKLHTESLK